MSKITFEYSTADIQAEEAHLTAQGISAYADKHIVLVPLIERIGKNGVDRGDAWAKEQSKDLSLFFPIVKTAERSSQIEVRRPVVVGDRVFSIRGMAVSVLPINMLKPVKEGAVYGLVTDYDVDLVMAASNA